jgi:soluble lytic murein transglycosylase-like protein
MNLRLGGFVASVAAVALVATASPDAHVVVHEFGGEASVPKHAAPPPPPPPLPVEEAMRRYARIVDEASRAHGVDRALVHAIIFAESSYDPNAVSAAGATGLMQLMPETARAHGVSDPFDPAKNVQGGVKHLKKLLAQFDGDVELALAAYNAGAGAVIRAGNRIPDNPETTAFVPKVIGYRQRFMASNTRS